MSTGADTTLLASVSPGETRWALLQNGRIVDVAHIRPGHLSWGTVIAGRIGKPVPGQAAVFVPLAVGPDGYLEKSDGPTPFPPEGALVPLIVRREAVGAKGPKLAAFAGPFPAGEPTMPGIVQHPMVPQDWIVPGRDRGPTVIVDNAALFTALKRCPDLAGADIAIDREAEPLFERFGVEDAIDGALLSSYRLSGGGVLHFAQTEALTAVDVDTGTGAPQAVAAAAAREIAAQCRLRGLAGQILVDFPRGRRGVPQPAIEALRAGLATDPLKPKILGVTRGGLVELVRARRRAPLAAILQETSRTARPTAETALLAALRRLARGAPRARRASLMVEPGALPCVQDPVYAAAIDTAFRQSGLAVRLVVGESNPHTYTQRAPVEVRFDEGGTAS